jgi:ATP-binding cassette subfamily C protein
LSARFAHVNESYLRNHAQASDRAGMLAAASKVVRYILQSFVLGLGAYLVIIQEASAGVIIASAILVSRALAPVELGIANWKGFVAARQARKRLTRLLAFLPERQQPMQLPRPSAAFAVEGVTAAPPGTNPPRVTRPASARAAPICRPVNASVWRWRGRYTVIPFSSCSTSPIPISTTRVTRR